MLTISVRSNLQAVARNLSALAQRQLPFATAKALTATAKDVQTKMTAALPRQLDKPTPFTMRAFGVVPATKRTLTAKVFVKPAQWKYLQYQIYGGVRIPTKRALILPKAIKLNQFGNLPRAAVQRLLAKAGVFSGTVDGVPGIYQRKGKSVKLVVGYADKVAYRKRYPFNEIGQRAVSQSFDRNFRVALDQALATMR